MLYENQRNKRTAGKTPESGCSRSHEWKNSDRNSRKVWRQAGVCEQMDESRGRKWGGRTQFKTTSCDSQLTDFGRTRTAFRNSLRWTESLRFYNGTLDIEESKHSRREIVRDKISIDQRGVEADVAGRPELPEAGVCGQRARYGAGESLERRDLAGDKKKAHREKRSIVFIDESCSMLQPLVRRTWALKGVTPIIRNWGKRGRLSLISALTMAPRRKRFSLYFSVQRENYHWQDVYRFISNLLRILRRKIILVLDRWSVHRAAAKRLLSKYGKRIRIEYLPSYSPKLNPVENLWSNVKYGDLANFIPNDLENLEDETAKALRAKQSQPYILKGYFKHAKLEL